jgi:SAM-dependent methyltransferase
MNVECHIRILVERPGRCRRRNGALVGWTVVSAPMPGIAERVASFARQPAGRFAGIVFSRPATRQHRNVLRSLDLSPRDTLLEIGPGAGVLLEHALRLVRSAAAIDHSQDMVDATMARNAKAVTDGRLDVRCGEAGDLPWPDESFTAVLSTQVFFWLPDPDKTLAEIFRVLAPRGRLALMTMANHPAAVRWLVRPFLPFGGHVYTDDDMQRTVQHAGLTQVRVHSSQGLQYVWATKPNADDWPAR